jgi:hypothetical protein
MKSFRFVSGLIACVSMIGSAMAGPVVSYFPRQNLGQFLADNFDLATIRSSLNPRRRTDGFRTFKSLGMKPSKATETTLVFDSPGDWFYEMKIVGRRDVNGDGVEDLEVCFADRALNGGTYNASEGLLITRYSATGHAVALSFSLDDGVCANDAR